MDKIDSEIIGNSTLNSCLLRKSNNRQSEHFLAINRCVALWVTRACMKCRLSLCCSLQLYELTETRDRLIKPSILITRWSDNYNFLNFSTDYFILSLLWKTTNNLTKTSSKRFEWIPNPAKALTQDELEG